jgi:hypothetical protein
MAQTQQDRKLADALNRLFVALGTVSDLAPNAQPAELGRRLAERLNVDDNARESIRWALHFLVELL